MNHIDPVLVSFSFVAGAIAFINPCGFALLPAYISLYLGLSGADERGRIARVRSIINGALFGLLAAFGFTMVFGGFGALVSLVGTALLIYIPWIAVAIGVGVIVLGVLMVLGRSIHIGINLVNRSAPKRGGYVSFVVFGITYALASLSCTMPIFLYIVLQALSVGSFIGGMAVFLSYAGGMGILMIMLTIGLIVARETITRYMNRFMPYINRVAGAIVIAAGGYIIYFQVFLGGLLSL